MTTARPTDLPIKPDLPIMHFRDAAAWESWLAKHPAEKGVWLQFAKKGQGVVSVSYAEALDVALCHGWIDGQKKAMDARFYLLRFTPRRPKSIWSKINIEKVATLIADGRMQPAGLLQVEAAKTDGRWALAYDSPSSMEPHRELVAALGKNKKARMFFDKLDKANRYAVCWRVQTAKTPARRASRIANLVAMLAKGETIHPSAKSKA